MPAIAAGGPHVPPLHAASGVGYGTSRVAQQHRHVPDGWIPAAKYFLEELGVDVNIRDADGFTALHHAAARGDNAMIKYLVSRGADVMAVNRAGQTTVDMANSPEQRTQPFPETIALLEGDGRQEQPQLPRLQVDCGRAHVTYRPFHCRSSSTATACVGFLCSNCSSTAIPSFERPVLKWIFASVT